MYDWKVCNTFYKQTIISEQGISILLGKKSDKKIQIFF